MPHSVVGVNAEGWREGDLLLARSTAQLPFDLGVEIQLAGGKCAGGKM